MSRSIAPIVSLRIEAKKRTFTSRLAAETWVGQGFCPPKFLQVGRSDLGWHYDNANGIEAVRRVAPFGAAAVDCVVLPVRRDRARSGGSGRSKDGHRDLLPLGRRRHGLRTWAIHIFAAQVLGMVGMPAPTGRCSRFPARKNPWSVSPSACVYKHGGPSAAALRLAIRAEDFYDVGKRLPAQGVKQYSVHYKNVGRRGVFLGFLAKR